MTFDGTPAGERARTRKQRNMEWIERLRQQLEKLRDSPPSESEEVV